MRELTEYQQSNLKADEVGKKVELLNKSYSGESICDAPRDFSEAFNADFTKQVEDIPVDHYGFATGTFSVNVTWRSDESQTPGEMAYSIGAKGAPPSEEERRLFEDWMRGHCWALGAEWDGVSYRHESEVVDGHVDPQAMMTRRLWAAWRDRAALGAMM